MFLRKTLRNNRVPSFFILFFLFLIFPRHLLAVELKITSAPDVITMDEFVIGYEIIGAKSGKNYLRAIIQEEGAESGYLATWNGVTWYEGSSGKEYAPVDITGSNVSGTIKAKLGEKAPRLGSKYSLTLRRYTASGAYAKDNANNKAVSLNIEPTPEPTPSPLPTPKQTTPPTKEPTNTPAVIGERDEVVIREEEDIPKVVTGAIAERTEEEKPQGTRETESLPAPGEMDSTQTPDVFLRAFGLLIGVIGVLVCIYSLVGLWKGLQSWYNSQT